MESSEVWGHFMPMMPVTLNFTSIIGSYWPQTYDDSILAVGGVGEGGG